MKIGDRCQFNYANWPQRVMLPSVRVTGTVMGFDEEDITVRWDGVEYEIRYHHPSFIEVVTEPKIATIEQQLTELARTGRELQCRRDHLLEDEKEFHDRMDQLVKTCREIDFDPLPTIAKFECNYLSYKAKWALRDWDLAKS